MTLYLDGTSVAALAVAVGALVALGHALGIRRAGNAGRSAIANDAAAVAKARRER